MPELNWSLNRNYINEIDLPENKKQSNTASLQWGLKTPSNKMGEKLNQPSRMDTTDWDLELPFARENPVPYMHMISTSSGAKPVQCRLPADNEIAVVDWVNFTIGIETVGDRFLNTEDSTDENRWMNTIIAFDEHLEHIFGFSTTSQNKSGRNFYKQSYVLGQDMGLVCIGGQRNTILVMLSGKGCAFAESGWEKRLYTFLTNIAKRAKLTRIDLAHDDFDGKHINVDWGNYQDDIGGFQCGNRAPNIEYKGNWKRPNGRGRTLNIGSRESGKYLRLYEKGRAEGDPDDNWQRCEVEFKAVDRILPFDMLLAPSEYLLSAYPCFKDIAPHIQPARIETLKKNSTISAKAAIETIKRQYGKYINLFKQVFEPEELINLISHTDQFAYPKRLDHVLMTAMRM